MQTLIAVIIIFGLIVAIHEWGHLYFAKKMGILCREFAIGFGPKLYSKKKNETLYTIRLFPIGGFVRMAGEDPESVTIKPGYEIGLTFNDEDKVKEIIVNNKAKHPNAKIVSIERIDLEHEMMIEAYGDEDEGLVRFEVDRQADLIVDEERDQLAPWDRQFGSKKPWQKAVAIFAGPLMNFVLAILLFVTYNVMEGVPVPIVDQVMEGSPAEDVGLAPGDEVLSINGEEITSWGEMSETIQTSPGEELSFHIERADSSQETILISPDSIYQEPLDEYFGQIGVVPESEVSFMLVITDSFVKLWDVVELIADVLSLIFTGEFSIDMLAGPVGIYDYTGEVVQMGYEMLFFWAGILSVNIGIMNLLPIPALDGGRLVFIGLEAIRGKPIDPGKEGMAHFVGFALLMLLVIMVTWNDITRLFL
ncbi:membrane-associated zinc metalloprotease [Geomicrobium sp. JCM 19037]|uniref:RIP metalloprotease RseP n=1 Tax=Geomicrobium sp. JCM 19037 TaxID=1460634 RepID=UPI00045F2E1A|nr:RIP metalloprotease RseP [Geomicrobium sp. JCM 19037]GAK02023.1 membrane-associated zinc metalloprotease [Geomicrobium sp. JCM 19037]